MQTRILNLPSALQVANILNKYFPRNLEGMDAKDFTLNLFSQITPEEGVTLITALLGKEPPSSSPEVVIKLCIDTLIENKIVTLLDTYRSIGF